jgi:hypothetical protein
MNPLRLLTPCLLTLLAVPSLSCSTKAEPVTSGGAYFQLQGGPDYDATGKAIPGKFLSCPDGGKAVTISVKGSDGSDKLLVDGADGATAACTWTGNTFSVNVSNAAGTMIVGGTYSITGTNCTTATPCPQQSTDAHATIHFPGATYRTVDVKCTVDFDMAQSGDGGKLYGKVSCPKLEHTSVAGAACAINAVNGTFFRFANCKY